MMPAGTPLVIKRVQATILVLEVEGRDRRFLVVAPSCAHDALTVGQLLTVRAPDPAARPSAVAGIHAHAPCGCTFTLIRDPFDGQG